MPGDRFPVSLAWHGPGARKQLSRVIAYKMEADSRQGLDDGAVSITVIQDGRSQVKKLVGPGGTMRVAVGRPGRRSGIWRIWAPSNKPEVYVKSSDVGELKLSLHGEQDGRSHWH